jgi:thymidylate synthase (FAD)
MKNIILEPAVHVLSVPQFFDHPKYKLPPHGTASERLIAHAGKGCYDAYGDEGRGIDLHINNLIGSGHGSVLEHANISVFIEGVSRGCSHEIVRHRAGFAYSQRSTRYTREDDAAIVLEPYQAKLYKKVADGTATMDEAAIINTFVYSCQDAVEAYRKQVEWLFEEASWLKGTDRRKWARGKARQLLPHALETRLTMTGNLRAWRHFFEQRSAAGAEAEIRRLSNYIFDAILLYAPLVMSDYEAVEVDGFNVYTPQTRKV